VIVDGHNDVLLEHVERAGSSPDLVLHRGREQLLDGYWLPKLEAAGVGLQICPLFASTVPSEEARAWAAAQEEEFRRTVEQNPDRVRHVRTRDDLDDTRFQLLLSMEGLEPLEGDPDAFDEWYGLGVRSASLTWNHANEFAGGVATPEQGLSERGRALVRKFAELNVLLDLAHASEQTWRDVLAEEVPFSVTHACCRAVHDHQRNLADWQLEALAERGGVLGVMAVRFAVGPESPTISRLIDHIDQAVAVMGVEHVGIGADFIKLEAPGAESPWIDGFAGPAEYPALVAGLRERGYDGEHLDAILGGNWLRILRETLAATA